MRMVVENGSSKVVLFVVNCSDASDSSAIKQYCMMASETILAIKLGFRQINKTRIFGLHPRKKKKNLRPYRIKKLSSTWYWNKAVKIWYLINFIDVLIFLYIPRNMDYVDLNYVWIQGRAMFCKSLHTEVNPQSKACSISLVFYHFIKQLCRGSPVKSLPTSYVHTAPLLLRGTW